VLVLVLVFVRGFKHGAGTRARARQRDGQERRSFGHENPDEHTHGSFGHENADEDDHGL